MSWQLVLVVVSSIVVAEIIKKRKKHNQDVSHLKDTDYFYKEKIIEKSKELISINQRLIEKMEKLSHHH